MGPSARGIGTQGQVSGGGRMGGGGSTWWIGENGEGGRRQRKGRYIDN